MRPPKSLSAKESSLRPRVSSERMGSLRPDSRTWRRPLVSLAAASAKHFKSKDQLVSEACREAVEATIHETLAAAVSKGAGFEAAYLSINHRDNLAIGCPLSAIGSELARSDEKTRGAATDGFLRLVEIMARQFDKIPPDVARRRALVAVSTMIGALMMSRVVTDPESCPAEIPSEAEQSLSEG